MVMITLYARQQKRHMSPTYIAAIFTIVRTWNQPRCSSTDEWIKKLWYIYIYTMEYYSVIQRNTFESVVIWWMNLKSLYRVK